MPNLLNLWAESNADFIGDDAQPTLRISNTSSGPGLRGFGLVSTSGASLADVNVLGTSTTAAALIVKGAVGNMSIGVLKIHGNSVASGAVLEFATKGFVSITSIKNNAAYTDYAIRVQVGNETRWIACYQDGALNGAAAF